MTNENNVYLFRCLFINHMVITNSQSKYIAETFYFFLSLKALFISNKSYLLRNCNLTDFG